MHSRREIIENHKQHYNEIIEYFKRDLSMAKRELNSIKTADELILKEKEKMTSYFKKAKVSKEIGQLIISEKNIYPIIYAWWDVDNSDVKIYKYGLKEGINTIAVLIDMRYSSPINSFEEFYGEHVSYKEIEQSSYIELKEMLFDNIDKDIKFRKYGRIGNVLTVKADMLKEEVGKFKKMINKNKLSFTNDWIISNVTIIKDNAKLLDNGKYDMSEDEIEEED